jgi:LssY-like putative type I secretion system component LssY
MGYLASLMMLLGGREIPAGTHLEIRLTTPVGTYASKVGAPVSAVLTAAVMDDRDVLLPAGSTLCGEVKAVRRVGLGIVHETSAIRIEFNRITLPDSTVYPISARVMEVDNARERVGRDGLISAERSTGSLSNRAAGYVRMAVGLNLHAQLGLWAVKTLLVDVPEPEIYYPAGVDLTLLLTEPVTVEAREETDDIARRLTDEELATLEEIVASIPERTANRSHHASDVINVMLLGSREQLSAAFLAAGWSETAPATFRSHLRNVGAVLGNTGNRIAPMSTLLLDGETADMMWQKGLNDVGKRHHIRIWKRSETWNGQEIWMGAATHDVDYAFLRPGMLVTHRIAQDIDRERDKVVHDLEFESSVDMADWIERPEVSRELHNATGDRMTTDGRLAVVRVMTRPTARLTLGLLPDALPRHGKMMERFARREILSMRNELIRNNSYWRSYEAIRWAVTAARKHQESGVEVAEVRSRSLGRVSGVVALR